MVSRFKTKVDYTPHEMKRIVEIHKFFTKIHKEIPADVLDQMYGQPEDNGVVQ